MYEHRHSEKPALSKIATVSKPYTAKKQYRKLKKKIFPEKELGGYSPNSYIYVSVSDLYIPLIGLSILLREKRWAERGNV